MAPLIGVALFLLGAVLAWLLVRGMRHWAVRLGLIDVPNQRSLHTLITPRGGGAAIVAISLVGFSIGAVFGVRPDSVAFGGYLAGALLIVTVSLVDDVLKLSPGIRLAVHLLGACLMVAGLGLEWPVLAGGSIGITWLTLAGAVLWTAGLTNAYNFMDGIDGIAALQAVVAGLSWTLLGSLTHQPWLDLLGVLVAGSSVGFLIHNWPPAKIFMGDVGSAFLGFSFAFMALAELRLAPHAALVGALVMELFIFDTTFTMLRRFLRGENIFLAHRSHIYQRLVLAGWSQALVSSLYGLGGLVIVAIGTAWLALGSQVLGYLLAVAALLLPIGLLFLVGRAERQVTGARDARPLMGRGR